MKRKGILITLILIAIVAAIGGLTVSRMKKIVVIPTPTPVSNMDLNKDVEDVDAKLKALNVDASVIDQSLNDQQGNLSEQ